MLFLLSVKLSGKQEEIIAETYDVEIAPEEIVSEEMAMAETTPKRTVETNRAYNEAEKFISSIEKEYLEITETTEGKLVEMSQALEDSRTSNGSGSIVTTKPEKEQNKKFSNSETRKEGTAVVKSDNRNTTISYRLVNRSDLALPNPVYTCYGSGKVVINIEVDRLGKVMKNIFNKTASTTQNQCLIDAALMYSAQARFSTDTSKEKQLGTITFNFPGQR